MTQYIETDKMKTLIDAAFTELGIINHKDIFVKHVNNDFISTLKVEHGSRVDWGIIHNHISDQFDCFQHFAVENLKNSESSEAGYDELEFKIFVL